MSTSTRPSSIVTCQDCSVAVVQSDPRTPRVLEIIAIFSDTSRARDYADRESSRAAEPAVAPKGATTRTAGGPPATTPELSARQSAVLGALRAKMDSNKQVEAKVAGLAEAANIPLGSFQDRAVAMVKTNAETAVALGEKITKIQNFQELLTLQAHFAQDQMQAFATQTQELQRLDRRSAPKVRTRLIFSSIRVAPLIA